MFGSIAVLLVLPWLDTSKVRSATFRPIYKWLFWVLVIDCVVLTWVGGQVPDRTVVWIGQFATLYYFVHFLVILPILGKLERPRPLPTSIDKPVLGQRHGHRSRRSEPMSLRHIVLAAAVALPAIGRPRRPLAAEGGVALKQVDWPTNGIFGSFDRAATQRGFQVYREVCAACHGLKFVAFRNLAHARLLRRRHQGVRGRIDGHRRAQRRGRHVRATWSAVRPDQRPVTRTSRRPPPPTAARRRRICP